MGLGPKLSFENVAKASALLLCHRISIVPMVSSPMMMMMMMMTVPLVEHFPTRRDNVDTDYHNTHLASNVPIV